MMLLIPHIEEGLGEQPPLSIQQSSVCELLTRKFLEIWVQCPERGIWDGISLKTYGIPQSLPPETPFSNSCSLENCWIWVLAALGSPALKWQVSQTVCEVTWMSVIQWWTNAISSSWEAGQDASTEGWLLSHKGIPGVLCNGQLFQEEGILKFIGSDYTQGRECGGDNEIQKQLRETQWQVRSMKRYDRRSSGNEEQQK